MKIQVHTTPTGGTGYLINGAYYGFNGERVRSQAEFDAEWPEAMRESLLNGKYFSREQVDGDVFVCEVEA